MTVDGVLPLAGAIAAVVSTAVLLAARWDRWPVALRAATAAVAALSLVTAVGLQLNRMTEAFVPEDGTPAAEGVEGGVGGAGAAAAVAASGSRLLTLTVPGRASHLTLTMYVYLPAAYRHGHTRFPVIEGLHGYPGSPVTWMRKLDVQSMLVREIAAGRMAPTVVAFPYQTPRRLLDTECTNLRNGPQAETFLTEDAPAYLRAHFRVRADRAAWGLTGYSAGAFCAINLALRHPGEYAAAAAMSGYAESGIRIGDGTENTLNNPAWRLRHLPRPHMALWLGWANDDRTVRHDSIELAGLARPPVAVTTGTVQNGGHSSAVWRQMLPPVLDWLSAHLARPLP